MDNKIIPVILAITVGIVVIAGALMPVLNDAAADTTTFSNRPDAMYEMTYIDENTDYSLIWRANTPTVVEVNGEETELKDGTILCSVDDWIIRFGLSNVGYYFEPISTTFFGAINSGEYPNAVATISISNGVLTYVTNLNGTPSQPITDTITDGYGIVANDGEYVMKSTNQNAYVLNDSRIVGMGITTVDGTWGIGFSATGTVADLNINQYAGAVDYTIGEETITSSVIDKYNSLSTIEKYEFDVTNPTTSNVTHITYSYFIVPAEVTAEKTNGAPLEDYKGIVFTIPVIVIAALLIMAITLTRRY